MRVIHIITGLNDGGAESALFRLCTHDSLDEHLVVSLSDEGKYGPLLREKGILVYPLHMRPNRPSLRAFLRLLRLLWVRKPDVIQTWMYHADLFGGIAARIAGVRNIVWGIRTTTLERGKSKLLTIWIVKLLSSLSWWMPKSIVVCALRAMDSHEALGYDRMKMRFIPNGYDLTDFTPKPEEARALLASWGVEANIALIGAVGRYDPHKDYANFLQALALLRSRNIPLRCVLVGTNLDEDNVELVEQIHHLGLEETAILLGRRTDIPAVMSALDVHVLPSNNEAFPNVVAEAMACETPCVVTDVGDAAYIVGDTGWVVPPSDAEALADAIETALIASQKADWHERCVLARKLIEKQFSIQRMVTTYSSFWREVKDTA